MFKSAVFEIKASDAAALSSFSQADHQQVTFPGHIAALPIVKYDLPFINYHSPFPDRIAPAYTRPLLLRATIYIRKQATIMMRHTKASVYVSDNFTHSNRVRFGVK